LLYILKYRLEYRLKSAIKRQIPFLIGGTVTGIAMTYYWGLLVTIVINSVAWYLISILVYKLVWRKSGLKDQLSLLRFFVSKLKKQNNE